MYRVFRENARFILPAHNARNLDGAIKNVARDKAMEYMRILKPFRARLEKPSYWVRVRYPDPNATHIVMHLPRRILCEFMEIDSGFLRCPVIYSTVIISDPRKFIVVAEERIDFAKAVDVDSAYWAAYDRGHLKRVEQYLQSMNIKRSETDITFEPDNEVDAEHAIKISAQWPSSIVKYFNRRKRENSGLRDLVADHPWYVFRARTSLAGADKIGPELIE